MSTAFCACRNAVRRVGVLCVTVGLVFVLVCGLGSAREPDIHVSLGSFGDIEGDLSIVASLKHVSDHVFVATSSAFIMLSTNLTYEDHIQLNVSNVDETIVDFTMDSSHTWGIIATVSFRMFPFNVSADGNSLVFEREESRLLEFEYVYPGTRYGCCLFLFAPSSLFALTLRSECWDSGFWWPDVYYYSAGEIICTHVALDSENFLWITTRMPTNPPRWREFMYDWMREFKPNYMFRVGPDDFPGCWIYVVELSPAIVEPLPLNYTDQPVATDVFMSEYFLYLRYHSKRGMQVFDPRETRNMSYPYTMEFPFGGIPKGADWDVLVMKNNSHPAYSAHVGTIWGVQVAANVFFVRVDMDNFALSADSMHIFSLGMDPVTSVPASLSAVVVDVSQAYVYVGDSVGSVQSLGFTREIESASIWDSCDLSGNVSCTPIHSLMYFASPPTLYVAANDTLSALSLQECGNYHLCDVCHGSGGLYCSWDSSLHECRINSTDVVQAKCATLVKVVPSREYRLDAVDVRIYGDFGPVFDYCCFFQALKAGVPFGEPANVSAVVEGGSDRDRLRCEAPGWAESGVDAADIHVYIANCSDLYVGSSVLLNLYDCWVEKMVGCVRSDFHECGYCAHSGECIDVARCANDSWTKDLSVLPEVVNLTPSGAPIGVAGDVEVEVSVTLFGSNFTLEYFTEYSDVSCRWSDISSVVSVSPANILSIDSSQSVARINCSFPAALVPLYVDVVIGGTSVTKQGANFARYDCNIHSSCTSCTLGSGCRWCLNSNLCKSNTCGGGEVYSLSSCPVIEDFSPLAVPLEGHLLSLSLSVCAEGTHMECDFQFLSSSWTTNATIVASGTPCQLQCFSPDLRIPNTSLSSLLDVSVYSDGQAFVTSPVSLSVYDCSVADSCAKCETLGKLCGWCVDSFNCTTAQFCAGGNLLPVCPEMVSLDPFEGSVVGSTPINVTFGSSCVFPASHYSCVFTRNGSSVSTPASRVLDTIVTCESPPLDDGFVQLSVEFREREFSKNSISFVYVTCEGYNRSCDDCTNPRRADCGWCTWDNVCTGISQCREGYFVYECPVLLSATGKQLDTVYVRSNARLSFSLAGLIFDAWNKTEVPGALAAKSNVGADSGDLWECVWNGRERTFARVLPFEGVLQCDVPRGWVGWVSLEIWHDGSPITQGRQAAVILRTREEVILKWSSASTIVCIVFTTLGIFVVFTIGLLAAVGTGTPVMRATGHVASLFIWVGSILFLVSNFLFLGEPNDAVCVARGWMLAFACNVLFVPFFVKVTHKILLVKSAWLRYKGAPHFIYPFAWVCLMFIDFCILLVWDLTEPPKATLSNKGEFDLVVRCSSVHSSAFYLTLYLLKVVPLCATALGFFFTGSVPVPFRESRYLLIALVNGLIFSAICLPLLFFSNIAEDGRPFLYTAWAWMVSVFTCVVIFGPRIHITYFRRSRNVKQVPLLKNGRPAGSLYRRLSSSSSSSSMSGMSSVSIDEGKLAPEQLATVVD